MCAVGNLRYTAIGLIIYDVYIVFFAVLTLWNKDRELDHFFIYISGSKRLPPYCTSLGQSREFALLLHSWVRLSAGRAPWSVPEEGRAVARANRPVPA